MGIKIIINSRGAQIAIIVGTKNSEKILVRGEDLASHTHQGRRCGSRQPACLLPLS
jgi:hypothetical protein